MTAPVHMKALSNLWLMTRFSLANCSYKTKFEMVFLRCAMVRKASKINYCVLRLWVGSTLTLENAPTRVLVIVMVVQLTLWQGFSGNHTETRSSFNRVIAPKEVVCCSYMWVYRVSPLTISQLECRWVDVVDHRDCVGYASVHHRISSAEKTFGTRVPYSTYHAWVEE